MNEPRWDALLRAAREVQRNAHAPYSRYRVGAALLGPSGRIYAGCNVENAAYGLTICAERSAIAQLVSAGETEIVAVQIVTSGPPLGTPCGMCRQTMAEFASDELPVRLALDDADRPTEQLRLGDLLPHAFRASSLRVREG